MSCLTIFARGDRALMLTDTAGTDSQFIVRGWAGKVATSPHRKLAMTVQGAAEALPTFVDRLTLEVGDLDAIVKHGAEVLADEHDANMMRWSDNAGSPEFRLGLVGWSEDRQRFEAWLIQSMAALGVQPFTFVRRELMLAPMLHESDLATLRIPQDGATFASDAQEQLLRIIKLQRRFPQTVAIPGGEVQRYGIGGEVIATELTPAGISQRVIHRWADKLDEPIQLEPVPAELSAPPPPPTGQLSRQQRRAFERAR